jgi:hypothetical protein
VKNRVPAVLELVGLALIVIAAALVAPALGLAVAGLGLLYLAYLTERRP